MDFGSLQNVEGIDFTLPSFASTAEKVKQAQTPPEIYIGLPIWADKRFLGVLYPPQAKQADFLHHYSLAFNAVELNATYYAIPKVETVKQWVSKVQGQFFFCPKVPRFISQNLESAEAVKNTREFFKVLSHFKPRGGKIFLQVPSVFATNKFTILKNYLQALPNGNYFALELRHESWFRQSDILLELTTLLNKKQFALVISDTAGRRDAVHMQITNDILFIRFLGANLHQSDFERIDMWVKRLEQAAAFGIRKVFFFIHEPAEEHSVELARYLKKQISDTFSVALPEQSLF